MEYREFQSELGNVAVSKEHVERNEVNSSKKDIILEYFDREEVVGKIHFSRIENISLDDDPVLSAIIFVTDSPKYLFFLDRKTADGCFRFLEYRLKAFRQNFE